MNVETASNPEIRKQKTIALLFIVVGLIVATLFVWIFDIRAFNTDVEETQCSIDKIADDACLDYKSTVEYETKVKERKRSYMLPIFLLLALVGIVIGFMFLPGYPFSKYLSYKECMQLAQLYPSDGWNWSSSQNSKKDLLCKFFGACRCRSSVQEYNCAAYSNQAEYDYDIAQKKNKEKNLCFNRCACCLANGTCAGIVAEPESSGVLYKIVACIGDSSTGCSQN